MVDLIVSVTHSDHSHQSQESSDKWPRSFYCKPVSIEEDLETGESSISPEQQLPSVAASSPYNAQWKNEFAQFRFRKIQPSDRQRIQELHEEWFPVRYQAEFYDCLVHGKMCHSGEDLHTFMAVDCDDQVVACLVAALVPAKRLNFHSRKLLLPNYQRHSMACYIMTLGTAQEYRKIGLATYLIEQCIQELVRDRPSVGSLYLHVVTSNQSAIRFYERLGFWRVQEIQNYYTFGGRYRNSYLYAKYFHGNRGHFDFFKLISWWISNVWKKIKAPLRWLFLKESNHRHIITHHRA